jgi:glycosyltransferase involved in cell wall biosynthesis
MRAAGSGRPALTRGNLPLIDAIVISSDPRPLVVAVVPAYNEARRVPAVVRQLDAAGIRAIVVDDGSDDDTASALDGAPCLLVRHLVNRGQGAAIQTGIDVALGRGADVIVTFDADGQHDAADVRALIAPILAGTCDVALGSRFLGSAPAMPAARRILLKGAILFTWLISQVRLTDAHNGLRAFSRAAAARLRLSMDGMAHASEIVDEIRRLRLRFVEVPVTVRYTPELLAKGQRPWRAVTITLQMLLRKLTT